MEWLKQSRIWRRDACGPDGRPRATGAAHARGRRQRRDASAKAAFGRTMVPDDFNLGPAWLMIDDFYDDG